MSVKYILDCPACGRVEGYAETELENDEFTAWDADAVIEEEVFPGPAGPVRRVRCPQCGRWLQPDRARPA